jgi:hypothetical protein
MPCWSCPEDRLDAASRPRSRNAGRTRRTHRGTAGRRVHCARASTARSWNSIRRPNSTYAASAPVRGNRSVQVRPDLAQQLRKSLTALRLGRGVARIAYMDEPTGVPNSCSPDKFACPICNYSPRRAWTRLFSLFNSPIGACPADGLGTPGFFRSAKSFANPHLSLAGGAVRGWDRRSRLPETSADWQRPSMAFRRWTTVGEQCSSRSVDTNQAGRLQFVRFRTIHLARCVDASNWAARDSPLRQVRRTDRRAADDEHASG